MFIWESLYTSFTLKNNFAGYRILGWWFFSFNTLNIPLHSVIACIISKEKSVMTLCISVVSVVTSPFSCLILLIWVLSLFFLLSLAYGLSILFIFSKNHLLVLLIFAIVLFVSISFIFALIFMISFLLLTLGFVCSSFSSSFRCKVTLFIWDFSCFLR